MKLNSATSVLPTCSATPLDSLPRWPQGVYSALGLLLVGMAASVVTNVVFGFAANVWTIMAFMAINGFAQATGWPSVVGIMANWTTRAERGTIMGVWATCYQFGGVAATAWAAYWLAQQGWQGSFFAASTVLTLVWFYVYFFVRNKPEDVNLDLQDPDDEVQCR